MTIEVASYISDLNAANPAAGDAKSEGDDHIRLIKSVLQSTLPDTENSAGIVWHSGVVVNAAKLYKIHRHLALLVASVSWDGTYSGGANLATLPAGYAPAINFQFTGVIAGSYTGSSTIGSDGKIGAVSKYDGTSPGTLTNFGFTVVYPLP